MAEIASAKVWLEAVNTHINGRLLPLNGDGTAMEAYLSSLRLNGVAAHAPQTVELDFRLPSRQEMRDLVLMNATAQAEDASFLRELDDELERYFEGEAARPWQQSVARDGITIHARGVPHDVPSIMNDAFGLYDEIRQGNITQQTSRIMDSSPYKEVAENIHSLYAVNGMLLIEPQSIETANLTEDLGKLAAFSNAMADIDSQTRHAFLPYVTLEAYTNTGPALKVNQSGQVFFNKAFLDLAAENPDQFRSLLLHEKSHISHEDALFPLLEGKALDSYTALLNDMRYGLLYTEDRAEAAKVLLAAADQEVETAQKWLDAIDGMFGTIACEVKAAADHIAAYPDISELKAATLAHDYVESTAFRNHMADIPPFTKESELVPFAYYFDPPAAKQTYHADGSITEESAVEGIDPAKTEAIAAQIDALLTKHADVCQDFETLSRTAQFMLHMEEYRADAFAAEQDANMVETEIAYEGEKPENFTHPSTADRKLLADAYADLKTHQRENGQDTAHSIRKLPPKKAVQAVARVKAGIKPLHIREQQAQGEERQR